MTDEISLSPTAYLGTAAISPDGTLAAIPSESGELFVFDTALGELVGEPLTGGGTQIQGVALSRDGETVAAVSRDGNMRLWDLDSGQQLGPALTDHYGYTKALAPVGPHGYVTGGIFDLTTTFWSGDAEM